MPSGSAVPGVSTAALLTPSTTEARSVAQDDEPNPGRVCLVRMEPGRPFEHYCAVCGAWGAWGHDVDPLKGRLGRWYCSAHRPELDD